MPRSAGRADDQVREFKLTPGFPTNAAGSVLVEAGKTMVLCTASVANDVPPWLAGQGKGWVTAEYSMLPGSTSPRKPRERQKVDGRTTEIQRLIGRSLRAVIDLNRLGERSVTVDCDVLRADGGTRTASITGGFVALALALASSECQDDAGNLPLTDSVAAISVGIVDGSVLVDLDYDEDFAADVDMNIVMTGSGRFVEVQGTGEEATFSHEQLSALTGAAAPAIEQLATAQRASLGSVAELF